MLRDLTIVVASHAIKAIEELLQNFFPCLSSINEVLVLRNVVNCVDILNADSTVPASVDEREGLVDHVLSALGEGVSQSADELLVGDVAIAVDIVVFHERLNLDNLGEETVGGERLRELGLVQLFVTVVIHAAEKDTKRANTDTTSLLDLHLELVVDAANFNVKADAVQLRHYLCFCLGVTKIIINKSTT